MFLFQNGWYCAAFCEKKQDIRHFELKKYYKIIVIIESKSKNSILDDYQMLIQSMYLTKYIAEKQNKDLSKIDYSPIVKKLYKYNGDI